MFNQLINSSSRYSCIPEGQLLELAEPDQVLHARVSYPGPLEIEFAQHLEFGQVCNAVVSYR